MRRRYNMAVQKISAKLKKLLQQAIARELQVAIQYMWQHVVWRGVKGYAVKDAFEEIAIEEMKHAEKIAERLFYLADEVPTTKPEPIFVGSNLKEMLEQDVKDEETAITMYKEIIKVAESEGDVTTAEIFRDILEEEEDHHDTFSTLLEEV
jgi:bacterioferritin